MECLTAASALWDTEAWSRAVGVFLAEVAGLVPSLPGPAGLFTGYGRIYLDGAHIELAVAECGSPYEVPLLLERLQDLCARAAESLRKRGIEILLANCNRSFRVSDVQSTDNYVLAQPTQHSYVHVAPLGSPGPAVLGGTTRLSPQPSSECRHGRHPGIDPRARR